MDFFLVLSFCASFCSKYVDSDILNWILDDYRLLKLYENDK